MKKGKVYIGTSGWSYSDWKEVFYPRGLKSSEWLTYYSKTFSVRKINASFYKLPTKKTVETWISKILCFCPGGEARWMDEAR